MKKNLFSKLLALFLSGTMLIGVGCKDYDDDIDDINKKIESLETGKLAPLEQQLASLQTTVSSLESAKTALEADIAKIEGQIADLTEQAADGSALEKLEQELADAIKAHEALEESINDVKDYCNDNFLKTADAVKTYATITSVADAVALAQGLKTYTTDQAISKAISDAKDAAIAAAGTAASSAFQGRFDAALDAALSGEAGKEGKIHEAIRTAIANYDATVHQCLTDALAENGTITKAIAEALSDAKTDLTAELQKWVSKRLTSLQLIPESYVNGIEAIDLASYAYTELTIKPNTAKNDEEIILGDPTTTQSQSVTIRYHVAPAGIEKEDILEPAFVFESAATRAAYDVEVLKVTDYAVADDELAVTAVKNQGVEIPADDAKKIITAALKVGIAHAADKEESAFVYSDYARLCETTVAPKIARLFDRSESGKDGYVCTNGDHRHFRKTFGAAVKNAPAIAQTYNKAIDLTAMVTGCYEDEEGEAHELTKETLAAAGLEFRFEVPQLKYTLGNNEANQQDFAYVTEDKESGHALLKSKLPVTEKDNAASVDKTPIVRVTLVDVNNANAIADVRYFKIRWDKTVQEGMEIEIPAFPYTVNCNDFTINFTWKDMVENVLAALNDGAGMSQKEFSDIYADATSTFSLGTGTVSFDANVPESAAAFTWTVTPAQIGTVIDIAGNQILTEKTATLTIEPQDPYQGTLIFKLTIDLKLPEMPAINGYRAGINWHSNYDLAYVWPVQYATTGAEPTVTYNYELNQLFSDDIVMKNLLPCGKWDIQFARDQKVNDNVYAPVLLKEPALDGNQAGYSLKTVGGTTAVTITISKDGKNSENKNNWFAGDPNGDKYTKDGLTYYKSFANDIAFRVDHNDAGIAYVENEEDATMKVWARLNDWNTFEVTEFDLHIVKPLVITYNGVNGSFTDFVQGGSKVNAANAFSIKDCFGETVAKTPAAALALWNYYDVKGVDWKLAEAKVNIVGGAIDNTLTDSEADMKKMELASVFFKSNETLSKSGDNLVFKNFRGVPIEKTVKLYIPVSIAHKWGVEKRVVVIPVNPKQN